MSWRFEVEDQQDTEWHDMATTGLPMSQVLEDPETC